MTTMLNENPSETTPLKQQNAEAWFCRHDNPERSLELAESIRDQAKRNQDLPNLVAALTTIGFHQFVQSKFEAALETLGNAKAIAHDLEDASLERDVHNWIGAVYARLGEFDTALEHVQRAYQLSIELRDEPYTISVLSNLALLHQEMERHHEAVPLLEDALQRAEALGDLQRQITVLNNLGASLHQLGHNDNAVQRLERALEIVKSTGHSGLDDHIRVNLAETQIDLGRFDDVFKILQPIISSCIPEAFVQAALTTGKAYVAQHENEKAIAVLQQALETATNAQLRPTTITIHSRLAQAHKNLGQHAQALEHFETYHTLERQLRGEAIERRLRAMSLQHQLEVTQVRNTELAQALAQLEERNKEKQVLLSELEEKSKLLEQLATEDALTGVYNRRHLDAQLSIELERVRLTGSPLALALFDVDHFKRVNDTYSHQVGDAVLQEIASIIRSKCRSLDMVARYGGEELVLLLPTTNLERGVEVCERIRKSIETFPWDSIHPGLRITISCGVAVLTVPSDGAWDESINHMENLVAKADAKMYEAKRNGKNQVRF